VISKKIYYVFVNELIELCNYNNKLNFKLKIKSVDLMK